MIIPRKNGTVRLVTDIDMLYSLGRPDWFTSLDLSMGYYKTPLDHESSLITAFVVPWGKYRYLRLPMGINTAVEEFHSRMNIMFASMPQVHVYLDDILICTEGSIETYAKILEQALFVLRDHGLIVNGAKCKIAVKEIEYLGYIVSKEGIRPDKKKIEAVKAIKAPTTRKQLRSFIGFVNYYRDLWRPRSHLIAPLSSLTSNSVKFKWTEEHQKAFEEIKIHIAKASLMAFPDYTKPF